MHIHYKFYIYILYDFTYYLPRFEFGLASTSKSITQTQWRNSRRLITYTIMRPTDLQLAQPWVNLGNITRILCVLYFITTIIQNDYSIDDYRFYILEIVLDTFKRK
jgi:hypothetical protein